MGKNRGNNGEFREDIGIRGNKIKKTKRGLRCPEQRRSSRTPKRGNSKTNGEARYKLYGKLKR